MNFPTKSKLIKNNNERNIITTQTSMTSKQTQRNKLMLSWNNPLFILLSSVCTRFHFNFLLLESNSICVSLKMLLLIAAPKFLQYENWHLGMPQM